MQTSCQSKMKTANGFGTGQKLPQNVAINGDTELKQIIFVIASNDSSIIRKMYLAGGEIEKVIHTHLWETSMSE